MIYIPKILIGKNPPYEYVYDRNPFDVINGSEKIRGFIEKVRIYKK